MASEKERLKAGYDKGVERANKLMGGGLDKLGEDEQIKNALINKQGVFNAAGRNLRDSRKLTSRYEKIADEGMSQEAMDAMRSKMAGQMSRAEKMAGMRMGGAMGGAKGAAAMANTRALQSQGMMGRANLERDLFLQNEQAKMQGLQGMQGSLAGERGAIQGIQTASDSYTTSLGAVKQFDIAQSTTEKQLRGSMGMQYEQMAGAEIAAEKAAEAQKKAAEAQKSDGITVVCTELHRQGLVDTDTWKINQEFGKYLYKVDPYGYFGYISWGLPLSKAMSKSKIITAIAAPFMKGWINYIAGEETLFNKTMYVIGRKFGNTLISMKKKFTQSSIKG